MREVALIRTEWRDPVGVLAAHADAPMTLALLSGGGGDQARWSYLMRDPVEAAVVVSRDGQDVFSRLDALLEQTLPGDPEGPPFQGGCAGLLSYGLGAFAEHERLPRRDDFPDAAIGVYTALLAFDHRRREVVAVGRADDKALAWRQAQRALSWIAPLSLQAVQGPLAAAFASEDGEAYEAAVSDVVRRIGEGEIFQANIARTWTGRLGRGIRPYDLAARLAVTSPAPFACYLRLEGAAIVSNSPERFLTVTGRAVESRPIKGTAPRGPTEEEDRILAERLLASEKDRAENLMIVDLMRNDLSRVCRPGAVTTPELFRVESFANVHHLVSTVRGELVEGVGAGGLFSAAFPPGSITGAPKVQAMKVIAGLEPPRGPFFGSMFWAGVDGALDSNVLIRTVAFLETVEGWRLEARAGGGIVADSDPASERAETEAKIDAVRRALMEGLPG